MSNVIAKGEVMLEGTNPQSSPVTPMGMIQLAVENSASVEHLEKLLALQERWESNQGRKAFDADIAAAKSQIPTIIKNREVDFNSQKGRTHYKHEDLAQIARVVDPILSRHGLSYRYRTSQDGNEVSVTCILSHRDGYSEETTLSTPPDTTGNKNSIQAIGSAVTYLQRYTLKLALGLSASDDDDGRTQSACELIDEIQQKELVNLIKAAGADELKLLKFLNVDTLEGLSQDNFKRAKSALNAKIEKNRGGQDA